MQGSDINITLASADADGSPAFGEPRIDERADIGLMLAARMPELIQLVKNRPRHTKGAPNPARAGCDGLHLDLQHATGLIRFHGVEQLRSLHREQQESELVLRQPRQPVVRKPDCVRKADGHTLRRADEHACTEDRIAQARGVGLYDIRHVRASNPAAIVLENVGFTGRDDKAELVRPARCQALDEVLADGLRSLAVVPVPYGQELLGEGEGLNTGAVSGRGNDAPHD